MSHVQLCFDTHREARVAQWFLARSISVEKAYFVHGDERLIMKDGTRISFKTPSPNHRWRNGETCACGYPTKEEIDATPTVAEVAEQARLKAHARALRER